MSSALDLKKKDCISGLSGVVLPKQVQYPKRVCHRGDEEGGGHLFCNIWYIMISIFSFKYYPGKHLQNRGPRGLRDWQICQVPDLPLGLDREARDIEGGPDDLQHLHPLCGDIDGGDGLGYHAGARATVSQTGSDRGSLHILVHNRVPAQVHLLLCYFATMAPSGCSLFLAQVCWVSPEMWLCQGRHERHRCAGYSPLLPRPIHVCRWEKNDQ